MNPSRLKILPVLVLAAVLAACGGGRDTASDATTTTAPPVASSGQVATGKTALPVSYYAAARFAEQASFGPTPELVSEIRSKGFERWIDDQFALPASQIDVTPFLGFPDSIPPEQWNLYRRQFPQLAVAAPDQLRLRVTWSLSQFITVSDRKSDIVGVMYWINMLQQRGLGSYGDLLYQVSVHPTMGQFLDNNQNRPKHPTMCPHNAPNENYARELMQLFTIGVNELNDDGTPVKDARGRFVETYSQRDVEELARVLTGWQHDPNPPSRPSRNWGNWGKSMVPTGSGACEKDSGAKTVMGRGFPAGQTQAQDLQGAIDLLMGHKNIAPFVATRMIQHLVKSNPSPAYVARIAAKFRNNGSGARGDMRAVVKAILLDPEARIGDDPAQARSDSGKFKEPFLFGTALWRGMGCRSVPMTEWGDVPVSNAQRPFSPESVFSFYAPTDRAPGSNLLAPEQRLVTSSELRDRTSLAFWALPWTQASGRRDTSLLKQAGCEIDSLVQAFSHSPGAYSDWLSFRYFRGAMPPTLRTNIAQIMQLEWPPYDRNDPVSGTFNMLGYALLTPYFGVSK